MIDSEFNLNNENEKILRCDYCNKSFTNKKGLTGHKEECLIQKVIYNEKEILELRHLLKEKDNHILNIKIINKSPCNQKEGKIYTNKSK